MHLLYIIMTSNKEHQNISTKLGRPINPERWLSDGTIDPNYYFKLNYHKPYTCEFCGKTRKCSDNILRHLKSARCVKARLLLDMQS